MKTSRLSSSHQIGKDQKCGSSWQRDRRQALAEQMGRDTDPVPLLGTDSGQLITAIHALPFDSGTQFQDQVIQINV